MEDAFIQCYNRSILEGTLEFGCSFQDFMAVLFKMPLFTFFTINAFRKKYETLLCNYNTAL